MHIQGYPLSVFEERKEVYNAIASVNESVAEYTKVSLSRAGTLWRI